MAAKVIVSQRVAVFGLGYVGLPLIRACVSAGHSVLGYDTNPRVVAGVNAGASHIGDVPDEELAIWLKGGFTATGDDQQLADCSVFIICVPTPLTPSGGPDLSAVEAASRTIARNLRSGALVVLESTTYPGTTEEVVKPILEAPGLWAGSDFALAFSPERIDPGNREFTFENTPKVVGGLTANCAKVATDFYEDLVDEVVTVKGLKEAEMTKLLENTYRHVNIALVNELSKISRLLGIDFGEVIRAAETKPYGFQAFRPGPGVGGHCIPIDPNYLSHRVRSELGQPFRFVELAEEINRSMPHYVVQRVQEMLANDSVLLRNANVLILGVTYKNDVADTRESPAYDVVRILRGYGAEVSYHDPYIRAWSVDGVPVPEVLDLSAATIEATCTLLLQSHTHYLANPELIGSLRLLDTRGALVGQMTVGNPGWIVL
jgi:nucleotide sugar dehydrogenase